MGKRSRSKQGSDKPAGETRPFPSGAYDGSHEHAQQMPLGDHLEELRRRIIFALAGIVPLLVFALIIGDKVVGVLLVPMRRSLIDAGLPGTLLATSPIEPFMVYIKVSLVLTLLLGAPWVMYQFWRFVAPGLYANERRFAYILLPMSFALSVAGMLFLYFVILPVVLAFFITFGSNLAPVSVERAPTAEGLVLPELPVLRADPLEPVPGQIWINSGLMQMRMAIPTPDGKGVDIRGTPLDSGSGISQQPRLSEFIKLFLSLAMAFAVGFQTPVVILLLGWAQLVTPQQLVKVRKLAMMGSAVVSAVLTPADPISMVLLAIPLYLLYELGGLLLRLMPARIFKYDAEIDADEVLKGEEEFEPDPLANTGPNTDQREDGADPEQRP